MEIGEILLLLFIFAHVNKTPRKDGVCKIITTYLTAIDNHICF